ncbi:MAG: energy transducer TonB [Deltaproteobacteria bacterium]|nr:energy transducer TonB [Deltaproteobacteria bacterium]
MLHFLLVAFLLYWTFHSPLSLLEKQGGGKGLRLQFHSLQEGSPPVDPSLPPQQSTKSLNTQNTSRVLPLRQENSIRVKNQKIDSSEKRTSPSSQSQLEASTLSPQVGTQGQTEMSGKESTGVGIGQGEGSGEGGQKGAGSRSGNKDGSAILSEIRRKIERSKHYPAAARQQEIEGVVTLRFQVSENGTVENLQLIKSSGSSLLDQEALSTVRRAVPFPYYPNAITIPLRFNLED